MGFFGDLFKESIKWNDNEIEALYAVLIAIGFSDGDFDAKEQLETSKMVSGIVDQKNNYKEYWEKLANNVNHEKMPKYLEALKSMHSKKKTYALYALSKVAISDDKLDDRELVILNRVKNILKI